MKVPSRACLLRYHILFTALVAICLSQNLKAKAQSLRIEKAGCVLTKEDSSAEYFLENITGDTINVAVINHREKFEDLGNNVVIIGSGVHPVEKFQIPPGAKMSLVYIVCVHSIGLEIGGTEPSNILQCIFYPKK